MGRSFQTYRTGVSEMELCGWIVWDRGTLSLFLKRFEAVGHGNPPLRTLHPDEGAWPEPTGVIKRAGFERKHVWCRLQNMIDADAAIRAEHTRNLAPAIGDTRELLR